MYSQDEITLAVWRGRGFETKLEVEGVTVGKERDGHWNERMKPRVKDI